MAKPAKRAAKLVKKLHHAETRTSRKMANHRDAAPVRAAGFLAELADQPQLAAIALATIGAGAAARRGDVVRGGVRMLAAHLATIAIKTAIKHRVDRSRPDHELDGHAGTLKRGTGTRRHELNSLPSGHTAGAVAAARAISRDVDGVALPAALAAGTVATVQPATGSHHLSDVVAGGLVGWLSEALVSAAFDRIEPAVERAWAQHFTSPATGSR